MQFTTDHALLALEILWRTAPVAVCCMIRACSNENDSVVVKYGFYFGKWRDEPHRLVTHMGVHANNAHLLSNVASYVAAICAFRPLPRKCTRQRFLRRLSFVACEAAVAYFVMVGGGIFGGLPALHVELAHQGRCVSQQNNINMRWLETLLARIFQHRVDRSPVIGASAAVASLIGFNVGRLAPSELACGSVFKAVALMAPAVPEVFGLVVEDARFVESWRFIDCLMGRRMNGGQEECQAASHAAHLGGFLFGLVVGSAWQICCWALRRVLQSQ